MRAAFFFFLVDASEALLSSSTYIMNDNVAKSKAPMDPECLYFGCWPLQGSQQQQPVSAAIQYLSGADLPVKPVRSGNRLSNHTLSRAPSAGASAADPCIYIFLVLLWERRADFLATTHLSVLRRITQAPHRLECRFAWNRFLCALQDSFRK